MGQIAQTASLLLLALMLGACGNSSSGTSSPPGTNGGAGQEVVPAKLIESKPFDSSTLGAMHGTIIVTGNVEERFTLGARKFSDCCAFDDVEHLSDILLVEKGKLQNAYVSVISGYDPKTIPKAPKTPVVIDQRGCIYTPHVTALQKGQPLHVATSDPTTHNVNLSAPSNKSEDANIAMLKGTPPLVFNFNRPDTVKVKCDIHPWMSAVVHVSKTPWFALSDKAGAFTIPNLAPGKYVIQVEHETLGKLRGSVTIEAKQSTGVTFEFKAP